MDKNTTSTVVNADFKVSVGIQPKTEVLIRLQVEGFHNWPKAFVEVGFLRDRHRHIFHIECRKVVEHDDRDIEIITLKRTIEKHLHDMYYEGSRGACEFGSMSCEMIAAELLHQYDLSSCEVTEDGENGAIVTTR